MLFGIGSALAWASAFGLVVVVALVCSGALVLTLLAGALFLAGRTARDLGAGLIMGCVLAGALQAIGLFALVTVYSSANPGWDLS